MRPAAMQRVALLSVYSVQIKKKRANARKLKELQGDA
ncbi:hypothetical protein SAMN05421819_3484 [Bryocella elongata]|uniref:Uncharacterized protein n=1 Tax=Bryocella elongata TaxID=863522 RepID=A0A1H6B3U3_9BACT|nr:hypothetical protein SAMN05421819_3484 [Bryocella elongata]